MLRLRGYYVVCFQKLATVSLKPVMVRKKENASKNKDMTDTPKEKKTDMSDVDMVCLSS